MALKTEMLSKLCIEHKPGQECSMESHSVFFWQKRFANGVGGHNSQKYYPMLCIQLEVNVAGLSI